MRGERVGLTSVRGVRVGQAESKDGRTGVTTILFDRIAPTVVDVRGGASGTYDTASLSLDSTFGGRCGIFFAGGSLFGLDAAIGLREAVLAEGGGARPFGNPNRVAPISGAILFDLPKRPGRPPDYAEIGRRAARAAGRGPIAQGPVGAGAGATVGKYLGRARADRGGVGTSARALRSMGRLGVLAVVNAVGAVRDPENGRWLAGPKDRDGSIVPPGTEGPGSADRGTTLVSVVLEVDLPRPVLQRIAVYAHDGLARTIHPAHATVDGDVVFVSTTARTRSPASERFPGAIADELGLAAGELVGSAIRAAVSPARLPERPRAEARSRGARG